MNEKPPNNRRRRAGAGILALWLGVPLLPLCAAERKSPLLGHRPHILRSATALEAAAADEPVSLSLVVQLDQALLDRAFQDIYGPQASLPRRYWSTAEFARRFDLDAKRQTLKRFAASQGLAVDAQDDSPHSMVVKISGSAALAEKAFGVKLRHYQTRDGRRFRANDADPLIPASLVPDLRAVVGLSTLTRVARPRYRAAPLLAAAPSARAPAGAAAPSAISGGTGPCGTVCTLSPNDIKSIYGLSGTSLNGSGQSVALFQLDGYTPSDITAYASAFNLARPPIAFIGVDGATNIAGADAFEVTMDIELVMALAPGLTRILVYSGPNTAQGVLNTYNKIATDHLANVVSSSWGLDEDSNGASQLIAEAQIFQRMAIQGQSMYAASGDCGAYDRQDGSGNCVTTEGFHVDDPASQPYVTGVGGTSLNGSVAAPVETVWNQLGIDYGSGGGGVSNFWAIPSYQVGVPGLASTAARNVPDVALNSDPYSSPYAVYYSGGWYLAGGTSAAAPLWAAMTALLNQERAANGNSSFGFANTTLYSLGVSTSASAVFNDITVGDNEGFSARTGYDNATGWGSFKGTGFISQTTNSSTLLIASTLDNAYAYPNPWDARRGYLPQITIANLPQGSTVNVFTLSGYWVKTLSAVDGAAFWDLTNDAGERVASGLYFYIASHGGGTAKGTIAIVR